MRVYHYPNDVHLRTETPRVFKRYQSYKRFLQAEFTRICVYCRQPDSVAPGLVYSVDHFRPKGLPEFAGLVCEYTNLYYCCPQCNSRKNDYWHEGDQPRFINPCDDVMAEHLRFDSRTGEVTASSPHGELMIELLQLNDGAVKDFRLSTLASIKYLQRSLDQIEIDRAEFRAQLRAGKITQATFDDADQEMMADAAALREEIQRKSGSLPLPPRPQRAIR